MGCKVLVLTVNLFTIEGTSVTSVKTVHTSYAKAYKFAGPIKTSKFSRQYSQ